jgi:hypothetical protein
MSKRALTNISNVNNDKNGIHSMAKAVKRTLDLSPNKDLLTKKNKILYNKNDRFDVENQSINNNNKRHELLTDPTRSIELKVKAIAIGSNSTKLSQKKEENKTNAFELPERLQTDESLVDNKLNKIDFCDPTTYYIPPPNIPDSIEDFDQTQLKSIESEPHYAYDIFEFYKRKELINSTKKYMQSQPELSKGMRSVLVDWMVEVQESFEYDFNFYSRKKRLKFDKYLFFN